MTKQKHEIETYEILASFLHTVTGSNGKCNSQSKQHVYSHSVTASLTKVEHH